MTDEQERKTAKDIDDINQAIRCLSDALAWLSTTSGQVAVTEIMGTITEARHDLIAARIKLESEPDPQQNQRVAEPIADVLNAFAPKPSTIPPGILELQRALRRPGEKPSITLSPRKTPPTDPNEPGYPWSTRQNGG